MKPKRVVSLLVAGCMAVSMVPASAVTAFAAETGTGSAVTASAENKDASKPETKGTCGAEGHESDVQWSFDSTTGVLSITGTGTGKMADYTSKKRPEWYTPFASQIKKVKIDDGVTYIGGGAFMDLTELTKVNIPKSITGFGWYIFARDTSLTTVEWANGFNAPEVTDRESKTDKDGNAATYTGQYVPSGMFDGCTSLGQGVELTEWLPKSFTGVACPAFRGTQFKVDFDRWDNLSYIGAYAFDSMPHLDSFTVTDKITFGCINGKSGAFGKSGLKNITFDTNDVDISLVEKSNLEQLDVTCGTIKIPSNTWRKNETLKKVKISAQECNISEKAFYMANALETFSLKTNSVALQSATFSLCKNLKVIDLSQCKNITYVNRAFLPNDEATVPEGVGATPSNVVIYVNSEENNPRNAVKEGTTIKGAGLSDTHGIVMVTNGGTVDLDKVDDGFNSVTKAGYTVEWYTNQECTTKTTDTTPQVGKTYYAKWTQGANTAVLSTDMENKWYTVGKEQEFSFTTHVDGTPTTSKVKAVTTFNSAKDSIIDDGLWYLEKTTANPTGEWKTFNGTSFGPSDGFQMGNNITSNFKVTFKKAGTYSFNVAMKEVNDKGEVGNTVCEKNVTIHVLPSTQTLILPDNVRVTVNGDDYTSRIVKNQMDNTNQLDVTISDLDEGAKIAVSVKNANYGDTYEWSGVDGAETSEDGKTYTFTVTNADAKVELKTTPYTYSVGDFDVKKMPADCEYDGEVHAAEIAPKEGHDIQDDDYRVVYVQEGGIVSEDAPRDVGKYTVNIIKGSETYKAGEFSITPANATRSDFDVTLPENVVADGKAHTAEIKVNDKSLFNSDKVTFKTTYWKDNAQVEEPVEVGDYTVQVEIISEDPNLNSSKLSWNYSIRETPAELYTLTVKDGTVKVNGKDATTSESGAYAVEKDAKVEVTFDKSTLSDAQVFDQWTITPASVLNAVDPKSETISFTMPAEEVTIKAMTRDATIEDDGPGVLGTAAMIGVGVAGTAVLGYQGYMIGTELYLNNVLPAGAAIPTNTAELAKLVWNDAGKPAPAAVLAADATDEQKALTWAIENQLISADKAADASVTRWEVIQTWNQEQEMKKA